MNNRIFLRFNYSMENRGKHTGLHPFLFEIDFNSSVASVAKTDKKHICDRKIEFVAQAISLVL